MAVPQQAHHIIPEAVFDEMKKDFMTVFGNTNGEFFKQLGGNFIYLHSKEDSAQEAQALLADPKNKDLFGDIAVGGAWHRGSHPSDDATVTSISLPPTPKA